jgi:hypothetical protein
MSQKELQDQIEVSAHHVIHDDGVSEATEYEVHTGMQDEYRISEELYRLVLHDVGLDLKNGYYRSGCEVVVVEDS